MMSFEECQEMGRRIREEERQRNERMAKIRDDELRKKGINPDAQKNIKPKYDHPSMPEDGFVTFLYIAAMIGSLIFKDFWIAWIALSIAYGKFITRHDND